MKNKVLLNKSEKMKRIEEAALALFSCNEVHQISIDQIAQKARVAKGTFYCDFLVTLGYTRSEAYQLLFMILELVSTLCYTAIVLHQPDDIEQLKPMLFTTIRKMIERS